MEGTSDRSFTLINIPNANQQQLAGGSPPKPSYGRTPLHVAVMSGDIVSARLLLDNGAIPVDQGDLFGYTALHLAVHSRRHAMTSLLLDHNASLTATTDDGRTAFDIAAAVTDDDADGVGVLDLLWQHLAQHLPTALKRRLLKQFGARLRGGGSAPQITDSQQGAQNRQNRQTIRDIIWRAEIGNFEIDLSLGTLAEVNEEVKYFNDHVDECRVCEFDEEVDGDTLCIEGLKYWVGGIDCGCDEMCAEDPVTWCGQCEEVCCIHCDGGSECELCGEYICGRCNSKHQCAGGGAAPTPPAVHIAEGGGAGANARAARKRKAPVASDADDVAVKLLDSTPRVRSKLR